MTAARPAAGRTVTAWRWIAMLGCAALVTACGGGGGGGGTAASQGTLRVALTDAPACGYDHVWVTIEKVSVHQSSSAAEADAGWTDLTLSPARRVDLLTLTNGVLEELGSTPLAAGRYSQIRLVLAGNSGTGSTSVANAVQPTGGPVIPLSTPSAQQSGLKLQAHVDVAAGQVADVVLDFDACKSIVKAGNSGNYILKPVISVVPRVVTGLQGFVTTTLALGSTTVSAQQDGVTLRTTVPDATGRFSIPYLATGTYTLVIASEGRATGVITNLPVGTSSTAINGTATAIVLPASSMADVTGTVSLVSTSGSGTVTTALTDAVVSASQALTGGPTILLSGQPVDSTLGTYRFHLPTGAPVKAAYTSPAVPLTFVADTAAAGKYSIKAEAPGRAAQTKPADISTGVSATVNFSYGP
ncbi:DUF4382 domain-containing protein [Ramlibacter sp. WS9]|uniref:DUF4382 domain-containing protein n=1 Tax=Ramlibacter sp. WS9 TaxID=1882741 RepID=UPI001144F25F|nr:DUF4382 domain-containing protein [Ramlibacter sp. WS9]ROZ76198.1 DUF4382 domain-containing protein [Ramlibacter sp. WS9]